MHGRIRAGGECGVANDRFRVGVPVVGVGEIDAVVEQIPEPAFTEMISVAEDQVTAQLVHRDLKHEPRFFGLALS